MPRAEIRRESGRKSVVDSVSQQQIPQIQQTVDINTFTQWQKDSEVRMAQLAAEEIRKGIESGVQEVMKRQDEQRGNGRKRTRKDDDSGRDSERDGDENNDDIGFNPKLVKQLHTTVGLFNTLKDLVSNPMQKAIEDKMGGMAAGVIEQAFLVPKGSGSKKDIIDTLINSQMAYGIGQGLGSRAPELVESLGRTFGQEKAGGMIESLLPSRQSSTPPKSDNQSDTELLLSLDPNNPEHIAAYANTQGGISVDIARKMLVIHQDSLVKQMEKKGTDVNKFSDSGSVQQTIPVQQNPLSSHKNVNNVNNVSEIPQQQQQMDGVNYQQYLEQFSQEMAKEVGKVIGGVVDNIEGLRNELFALKSEMNVIKKHGSVRNDVRNDVGNNIGNNTEFSSSKDIGKEVFFIKKVEAEIDNDISSNDIKNKKDFVSVGDLKQFENWDDSLDPWPYGSGIKVDNAKIINPIVDNDKIINPIVDNDKIINPIVDNDKIINPIVDNDKIINPIVDNAKIINPIVDNDKIINPIVDNAKIINPIVDNAKIDKEPEKIEDVNVEKVVDNDIEIIEKEHTKDKKEEYKFVVKYGKLKKYKLDNKGKIKGVPIDPTEEEVSEYEVKYKVILEK